eukprot:g5816.t1
MDWVQLHCDRLRSKLQDVVDGGVNANSSPRIPWSWVCRSIIETVTRYPSGLTEAVILAELELLWRRDVRGAFVPGKLQAYLDAQYAPLSDVVQACVVRHADQLVTLAEDHSLGVSCDLPPAKCVVDMYLHQNFKSCLRYAQDAGHDLLAPGRKMRLTGCRLLTGATAALTGRGRGGGDGGGGDGEAGRRPAPSTLLLTEYLAFVLDHRSSDDLRLAASAFAVGRTRVRDTFSESSNHEAFFVVCKVLEIRRPRQHSTSGGGQQCRKRRQTLQTVVLECAARATAARPAQEQQHRRPGGPSEESTNSGGYAGFVAEDGGGCGTSGSGGSSRETVLLHLWDEQTCLTSLFRKGDGLVVYWPWLVQQQQQQQPQSGDVALDSAHSLLSQVPLPDSTSGWHFEYGSATALFVLPREGRAQLFAAANGVANGGSDGRAGTDGPSRTGALANGIGGGGSRVPSRGKLSAPGARGAEVGGSGGVLRAQEMPADENGVRDLLQFPRRVSVSDLAPNLSNVSVYGQVISVACVAGSSLPAVLPPSRATASANQASAPSSSSFLSQQPLKPVMLLQQQPRRQRQASSTKVVELWVRDDGGKARVFCCGRRAAADALRCRPGQYVLACGLRTLAAAFPPLDDSEGPGGDVVVYCGEVGEGEGETSRGEEEAAAATAPGRTAGSRSGGGHGGVGGAGGGDGLGRILNASCLEGLLHCPFLSRHSLLHDKKRAPGPRDTFACKVAVTWARWAFDGDGLWAVHRRCGVRLPCHYSVLCPSADKVAGKASRKRPREMRDPGSRSVGSRAPGAQQDAPVTCPLCKTSVRLDRDDEAELAFAPLLMALDDGTRCLVAECRSEVVTVALGGTNPHVYLQMGQAERTATLASLVGREIRCVVGGNGAAAGGSSGVDDRVGGGCADRSGVNGRVGFCVERIASTNPAADLAHALSFCLS